MTDPCTLRFQPIFAVIVNTDRDEGRGRSYTASLHVSHTAALRAAHGQGTFGTDALIKQVDGVIIHTGPATYILELLNLHRVLEQV